MLSIVLFGYYHSSIIMLAIALFTHPLFFNIVYHDVDINRACIMLFHIITLKKKKNLKRKRNDIIIHTYVCHRLIWKMFVYKAITFCGAKNMYVNIQKLFGIWITRVSRLYVQEKWYNIFSIFESLEFTRYINGLRLYNFVHGIINDYVIINSGKCYKLEAHHTHNWVNSVLWVKEN